jgi:hypothetical protein
MRFLKFKRPGNYGDRFSNDTWGPFAVYLEIDDQLVVRQVNVYAAGQILRYDRSHWCDDFGAMWMRRFSRKQKAAHGGEAIGAEEFERQWQRALRNGIWNEQVSHSRQAEWGTWEKQMSGHS